MRGPLLVVSLLALCGCANTVSASAGDGGAQAGRDGGEAACVGSPCDPRNCGGCGVVCAEAEVCAEGRCRAVAPRLRWAHPFRSAGGSGTAVATNDAGEVFVAGSVRGAADLGAGPTTGGDRGDPVIARYSRDGAARWVRRFGGVGRDAVTLTSLALDGTGALWAAGVFAYENQVGGPTLRAGSFLAGLAAGYTPDGAHRFSRAFTNPSAGYSRGASPDNRFVSAAATPDGEGVIGGYFEGPAVLGDVTLVRGGLDGIVVRYGAAGEVRWYRTLDAAGTTTVRDLAVDAAGDIVVTGIFNGAARWGDEVPTRGGFDTVVARLDDHGRTRWSMGFGGPRDDLPEAVALDRDGGAYVTGSTGGELVAGAERVAAAGAFVVALARDGSVRWARALDCGTPAGTRCAGHGVAVDRAGNVVVVGSVIGSDARGVGLVAMFSPSGAPLWGRTFVGEGGMSVTDVATDACGGIAVTGYFGRSVDLGGAQLRGTGSFEGFVAAWQE